MTGHTKFPAAIDDASSLYSPVDAFSTRPLETTAAQQILAGDSAINVGSTDGFPASYGILSIDDELIVYTAKNSTQFTGCQRGAFGTAAVQHTVVAAVKANMVSGFLTALQSAVVAIENELGTAAARNYILRDGAVTITGIKTFQDGAEFGSGSKTGTGLVRLPNIGGIKWRKADNSGDLGIALGANDHLVADAIIDFAAGQTFGAFSYPDATTSSKGIVQVDPVGGLAVTAGVLSLANTGAPGTYSKVTVDAKGRVTAGAQLVAGDLPVHAHAATDIVSGILPLARGGTAANLSATGPGFLKQASAGANVTVAALAAGDLPAHSHDQSEVTDLTADLAAKASKAGDTFTGAVHLAGDEVYLECGPFQTVGGAFENMAKFSEDLSAAAWDSNGGSCSVSSNAAVAPDGNSTADRVTASTATPVLQQNVAGLVDGGTYTLYVWGRVASGSRKISLAIADHAYASYLAGLTQITLTTVWQRFKITGTLAAGQTALWIVLRQYDPNGDDWTTGDIYLWGACLQQGSDPKKAYARTWAFQTATVSAGIACGSLVVSAVNNSESPLKVRGPGSNLADHTLLEITAGGELILAGGAGNGYRLAELMAASNPSGWSGVLKVKNPAGATAGYILLYTNP